MIRKGALLFAIFLPTIVLSQRTQKTVDTINSLTGGKKVVYYEFIGSGGGYGGNAPRLTKTTITKYDKNGKTTYISHTTRRLKGCIADKPLWDIIAYDSSGAYKTLKLKGRRGKKVIVLKSFAKEGKLISQAKIDYENFSTSDYEWIDNSDT